MLHRIPNYLFAVIVIGCFITFMIACNKTEKEENPYTLKVPKGWDNPIYNFENNPLSQKKFELGRKLFYDPILSSTNTISCGSCHQAFSAFAHLDHNVSHGVHDSVGIRNSPGLFNLIWHPTFMWDGGVNHIETQPATPITNPIEMGESLSNIVAKINADSTYKRLFKEAWGNDTINTQRIFKSITQFMGLMVSDNAKYDQYQRGEINFNEQELAGLNIFNDKCASCHKPPLFSDFSYRSNGLPLVVGTNGIVDSGRGHIEPYNSSTHYTFKVPSLRNLGFTRPYMHDGRFTTLNQVLDHYANIDANAPNLDPSLRNGIQLNSTERTNLLSFLNTLNDTAFVKDRRFIEQ